MPRTDPFHLPLAAGMPVTSTDAPASNRGTGDQAGRDARRRQPTSYPLASGRSGTERWPAAAWPLQSRLELAALPGAVPCARLHARQLLWEWGLATLAETAELLISELTTNAMNASADAATGQSGVPCADGLPVIQLCLASDWRNVLVQVWDSSHKTPPL